MNSKIYLIFGNDDFQHEKIKELKSILGIKEENVDIINPSEKAWHEIVDEIRTYSLFGIPRLFVIKDAEIFKSEESIEELIDRAFTFYQSKDFQKAGKEVAKILNQLDLNDDDLANIFNSPSLIEGYLAKYDFNISFIIDLIKQSFVKFESIKKSEIFDFTKFFSYIPDGHYVIITVKELDKRTKNFKIFQNFSVFLEKKESKISQKEIKTSIDSQIEDFIKKNKKKISDEDLIYLKEKALESYSIKTKLEKLSLISAESDMLTREDINEAFDEDIFPDSNQIPELIRKKDLSSLLKLVLNPKNTKADFIKLSGYLRSLLRNAIAIKEFTEEEDYNDFYSFERKFYKKFFEVLPKETLKNQHPYYLFQCYLNFKDFELEKLKKTYLLLFYVDLNLKSTQISPQDLFIDFFSHLFTKKNESVPSLSS